MIYPVLRLDTGSGSVMLDVDAIGRALDWCIEHQLVECKFVTDKSSIDFACQPSLEKITIFLNPKYLNKKEAQAGYIPHEDLSQK